MHRTERKKNDSFLYQSEAIEAHYWFATIKIQKYNVCPVKEVETIKILSEIKIV